MTPSEILQQNAQLLAGDQRSALQKRIDAILNRPPQAITYWQDKSGERPDRELIAWREEMQSQKGRD